MSIGSVLHAQGTCRPCIFVRKETACLSGVQCRFCHFPHHDKTGKIRLRPCKDKRDRYKKILNNLADQIAENPDNFAPEAVQLPTSIAKNEYVKQRMLSRLSDVATKSSANRSPPAAPSHDD